MVYLKLAATALVAAFVSGQGIEDCDSGDIACIKEAAAAARAKAGVVSDLPEFGEVPSRDAVATSTKTRDESRNDDNDRIDECDPAVDAGCVCDDRDGCYFEEDIYEYDCEKYPRDCEGMATRAPTKQPTRPPSIYKNLDDYYCPKGWPEHDGHCYKFFSNERPYSGQKSAVYGCSDFNYALLLNENEFTADPSLEAFVLNLLPEGTKNFWLDTRDWTKEYTSKDGYVNRKVSLPFICKLFKTSQSTSLLGDGSKCECGFDNLGQLCGQVGSMSYCCQSEDCKPRSRSSKTWIPGGVCSRPESRGPCKHRACAERGLRAGERGFCTEDCKCMEGEGPCVTDSDCWAEKCVEGVCKSDNPLAVTPEALRPLFICEAHADCPAGRYCDSMGQCWACKQDEAVSRVTCDALDGNCCSESFLAQCPSNPAECAAGMSQEDKDKAATVAKAAAAAVAADKIRDKKGKKNKAEKAACLVLAKSFKSACKKADRKKIGFAMQGGKGKCKAVKGCGADKAELEGVLHKNKKACKKAKKACVMVKAEGEKKKGKKKGKKNKGGN